MFLHKSTIALLFGIFVMSAQVQVQAQTASLADGRSGRIEFNSVTPRSRWDYLRSVTQQMKPVVVYGDLLLPKAVQAGTRVPAVVLSHGSFGVESNAFDVWAKELNAAGMAVFVVDSFKPRAVDEVGSQQDKVDYSANVADALNALKLLATHPAIDASKIYHIGFSRGGGVAFDTAWPMWQEPANVGSLRFAKHVAFYPGNCNVKYRSDRVERATAPILALYADRELEEAQSVETCIKWNDQLIAEGSPITYREYRGARHGFDGLNFTYRVVPNQQSGTKCNVDVTIPLRQGAGLGKAVDNRNNTTATTFPEFTAMTNACVSWQNASRGGGNARGIQADSVRDTLAFLQSSK